MKNLLFIILLSISTISYCVEDSLNTKYLGHIAVPGICIDAEYTDGYIYLATQESGLRIIDVNNPFHPSEVNHIDTFSVTDITIADGLCIMAGGPGPFIPGLRILNINNPVNPQYKGFLGLPGETYGIEVKNNVVFIGTAGGIMSVNISNLSNPLEMDFLFLDFGIRDLKIIGNYAYLITTFQGLKIVDISNPSNLIFVKNVNTTYPARRLFVKNSLIYVASNELEIFDLNNPINPVKIGSYIPPQQLSDIWVDNSIAYVSSVGRGLRVVDITNPHDPNEIGFYFQYIDGEAIAVNKNICYVGAGTDGMYIIAVLPVIISPKNGDYWDMQNLKKIQWIAEGFDSLKIFYSIDDGSNWVNITVTPTSTFNYDWLIPNTPSNQCKIKLESNENYFYSNISGGNFIIKPISLLSPNGGDMLFVGSVFKIQWIIVGINSIVIELSLDSGATWIHNMSGLPLGQSGYYDWQVPNYSSLKCLLKIIEYNGNNYDISDSSFSIKTSTKIDDGLINNSVVFELKNYPNPFNNSNIISISLSQNEQVQIKLYNLLGEELMTLLDGLLESGQHEFTLNATGLPSGIYFYKIQCKNFLQTQKIFLIR